MVSVILPVYLLAIGYTALQIGAIVTATLLGSAAVTLATGLLAHRYRARVILLAACLMMVLTGIGFFAVTAFVPLLIVAFLGTLNPTAGDVSLFLPIEQSLLASTVTPADRTALYARYNLFAAACGALGALASATPVWLAHVSGWAAADAMKMGFVVYSLVAGVVAVIYLRIDRDTDRGRTAPVPRLPLQRSRRIVLHLAGLFTLDSFGGGFVAQSLLALWLFKRFDFSLATAAPFFFATTLLAGLSQLASPRIAARIGLVRTMAYTHIPANLFLMLAALMPNATLAVAMLLARMMLSSMDVPARQALVMAVVPPEERAAAASVTNVPRSLGTGLAPLLAGWLLAHSSFGWPLLIGGALKILYDLLLLAQFRRQRIEDDVAGKRPVAAAK